MPRRLLLVLAFLAACDSSPGRDRRDLGAYTKVWVSAPFEVVLGRGEGPVVVDAPADWIPRVQTTVDVGVLEIRLAKGSPSDVPTIRVTVPSEKVDDVVAIGLGAVSSAAPLLGRRIYLSVVGGGTMQVETSAEAVVVQQTGAGSVTLTGATNRLDATVIGSGSLHAAGLSAKDAAITSTGSGNVELNVIRTLTCDVTGSGTLGYAGGAATDASQCRTTGTGRVERRSF